MDQLEDNMLISLKETKEVQKTISHVTIQYQSRYDDTAPAYKEDAIVTLKISPHGKILQSSYPIEDEVNIFEKVVDCGTYSINFGKYDSFIIENNYVPSWIPGKYGDYINLEIKNGVITNWLRYFTEQHIRESYESQNNDF